MPGRPTTLGHSRAGPAVLAAGVGQGAAFYFFHLPSTFTFLCPISWEMPQHDCTIVVYADKP